jgi:hypothetical protein
MTIVYVEDGKMRCWLKSDHSVVIEVTGTDYHVVWDGNRWESIPNPAPPVLVEDELDSMISGVAGITDDTHDRTLMLAAAELRRLRGVANKFEDNYKQFIIEKNDLRTEITLMRGKCSDEQAVSDGLRRQVQLLIQQRNEAEKRELQAQLSQFPTPVFGSPLRPRKFRVSVCGTWYDAEEVTEEEQ